MALPRAGDRQRADCFPEEFIGAHPTSSRWKLSRQLCEALGWKQANGALRGVVCRGLLLMLERAGQIEPNSGLGEAISYLLKHWKKLTAASVPGEERAEASRAAPDAAA